VAEVLAQLLGIETRETIALLSTEADRRHRLVAAQGTRRMDGQRISTYRFRHNLFQRYLYGQMDEMERAYAHEDVGNALESLYGASADEIAHQLARHFQEAGILPKAVDYLRRAGERATRLSANEEAIEHLRRGLQALETQPDSAERASQELALQLALGPPLLSTAGPGSEELARAYKRAQELCDRVGTAPQLFQTLFILVHHHANQGRGEVALDLAEQLLEVVERAEEPLPAVMAYWARAFSLLYIGRLRESLRNHEQVISLYDPERDSMLAYIFGMDPAVSSLAMGGVTLWILGYPDRAAEYMRRGIAHARDVNQPNSLAHALVQSVYLCMIRGDRELRIEQAEELFRLSTEHGVALFRAWGIFHQGWNLAEQGEHDAAIARLLEGIADAQATGSELGHPVAFWCLADVYRRAGRVDEALERIAEALAIAERTEDRVHEPEIHRSMGELLLERDPDSVKEAETCFRRAIEVARRQEARSWELRATVSLARLLRRRDRRDEAREMLAAVYGWFTEGLDTPDLKEAKALLDELS
jgi:predicted ATPase